MNTLVLFAMSQTGGMIKLSICSGDERHKSVKPLQTKDVLTSSG